jgi:hypothetical protein
MPRRCAADRLGRALSPGPNLHALAAAVKAGPLNGIPPTVIVGLPGLMVTDNPTPPGLLTGSGKFVMPCARMHCDAVSACGLEALVPAAAGWPAVAPDPPQAATASPQASAASTPATHPEP